MAVMMQHPEHGTAFPNGHMEIEDCLKHGWQIVRPVEKSMVPRETPAVIFPSGEPMLNVPRRGRPPKGK